MAIEMDEEYSTVCTVSRGVSTSSPWPSSVAGAGILRVTCQRQLRERVTTWAMVATQALSHSVILASSM
jgi:hypothetical protein